MRTVLTGERELIDCGRYGDRERFSDPHIGAEINSLARQDAFITVANPLALYIADLDTAGWETPDRSDPKFFWTIVARECRPCSARRLRGPAG